MATDPTRQAHGSAGAGHEADADLRQRQYGVGIGHDTGGEGRELDAGAHAGTVQLDDETITQRVRDAGPGCG